MKKLISVILSFCIFSATFVFPIAASATATPALTEIMQADTEETPTSTDETQTNDENTPEPTATPGSTVEKPVYLQDIIFAAFETKDGAFEFLEARGYTPYDYDIFTATSGMLTYHDIYLYMGYKTTTNVNMALTDIRMIYDEQQPAINDGMFSSVYSYNGAGYMTVPVRYEYQEFIPQSGLLGLMASDKALDGYEAWGSDCPNIGYTTARTLNFISFWAGPLVFYWLWQTLKSAFEGNYNTANYWSVYTTRSKKCGDPILADFFFDNMPQADGYVTATQFCSDTPYDMAYCRSSANLISGVDSGTWDPIYFHFKRATVEEPSEKTYISEIVLLDKTMSNAKANELGYTVIDKTWAEFKAWHDMLEGHEGDPNTFNAVCRIGYKTTHYKSKALTDIRLINSTDYHSPPRIIQFTGESYISVALYTYHYDNLCYLKNGIVECGMDNRRNGFDTAVPAMRNIYVTTSPLCGKPIEEISLIVDPEYRVPKVADGYQLARLFYNDIPIINGAYFETEYPKQHENYYIKFKGESASIGGKYVQSVAAGAAKERTHRTHIGCFYTDSTAIRQLAEGGATWKIDWNLAENETLYEGLCNAAYVGYSRTNDESCALTDIIILAWGSSEPPKSYYYNNIKYNLACNVDLNYGAQGDYLYLYQTRDPDAGSPIIDLNIRTRDGITDGELVVSVNRDGNCNLRDTYEQRSPYYVDGNRYLVKTRVDDNVPTYLSSITVFAGDSPTQASLKRAGYGYASYTDTDFNKGAGGDYIYICYNRTNDEDEAIRGLTCFHSESNYHPVSFTYNGAEYFDAGGADMNKGVGGDYIYLYYTKDEEAGDPINNIIGATDVALHNDGTEVVMRVDGEVAPSDANAGAGGDVQYIHYSRYRANASDFVYIKDIVTTYTVDMNDTFNAWSSTFEKLKKYEPNLVDGEWWIDKLDPDNASGAGDYLVKNGCVYAAARPFSPKDGFRNIGLYIGFSLTDNTKQAVRDIRYVPGERNYVLTDNKTGATYRAAMNSPIYKDGMLVFLYYSTDKAAGEPLTYSDIKRNYPLLPLEDYTRVETDDEPYYGPEDAGFYKDWIFNN